MREVGIDYFENSRRATYAQRRYACENPQGFSGYHENSWGVTASDGPGPFRRTINGKDREFHGYIARRCAQWTGRRYVVAVGNSRVPSVCA